MPDQNSKNNLPIALCCCYGKIGVGEGEFMFKKLVQKLRGVENEGSTIDPSQFRDPIAMQTDWTPLIDGLIKTRTYKLVKVNSNRVEFRATLGLKLVYLLFLICGLALPLFFIYFYIYTYTERGFSYNMSMLIPVIISLVLTLAFLIFSGCLFYRSTIPIVFDKEKGVFWKGRKEPGKVYDNKALKHLTELDEIHALQLISEYCSGNLFYSHPHYNYELNLVLENGKRINVIGLSNQDQLQEDADTISVFLDKPVWDALN